MRFPSGLAGTTIVTTSRPRAALKPTLHHYHLNSRSCSSSHPHSRRRSFQVQQTCHGTPTIIPIITLASRSPRRLLRPSSTATSTRTTTMRRKHRGKLFSTGRCICIHMDLVANILHLSRLECLRTALRLPMAHRQHSASSTSSTISTNSSFSEEGTFP